MRFYSESSRQAFTLLEVMVAMTLMVLVAAGAYSALGSSIRLFEAARDNTRVSQILQAEIERIRLLNWADLSALPASETFDLDNAFETAFPGRYSGEREILVRHPDQMEIILTVFWEAGNRKVSRSYRTFYTERGLSDYYVRTSRAG